MTSMSHLKEELLERLGPKIGPIEDLWKKMGLHGEVLRKRQQTLLRHVEKLFEDMLEEENGLYAQLPALCHSRKENILWLASQLQIPAELPALTQCLYEDETKLWLRERDLQTLWQGRRAEYSLLLKEEQSLLQILGENEAKGRPELVEGEHAPPSEEQLHLLRQTVDDLSAQVVSRSAQVAQLHTELAALLVEIGASLSTTTPSEENSVSAWFSDSEVAVLDELLVKYTEAVAHHSQDVENHEPSSEVAPSNVIGPWLHSKFLHDAVAIRDSASLIVTAQREKCTRLRQELHALWQRLRVCESQVEPVRLHVADLDKENESLGLQSSRALQQLLQREVNNLKELRRAQSVELISQLGTQIRDVAQRCFLTEAEIDTLLVPPNLLPVLHFNATEEQHHPGDYNIEVLEKYEAVLDRLNQYYTDHEAVFQGVEKWNEAFAELKQAESEMRDPSALQNRGGRLLILERQIRTLRRKLQRVEDELRLRCSAVTCSEDAESTHLSDSPGTTCNSQASESAVVVGLNSVFREGGAVRIEGRAVAEYFTTKWSEYTDSTRDDTLSERAARQHKRRQQDDSHLSTTGERRKRQHLASQFLDLNSTLDQSKVNTSVLDLRPPGSHRPMTPTSTPAKKHKPPSSVISSVTTSSLRSRAARP